MTQSAIEINDVSKRFRVYREKFTSLKERALHLGRVPYEDFWALKDVSFTVNQGETIGLLGHNGSGKSTLLKCIAGIQPPTKGVIRSRGRMAAMLELGAGFHPDLTGRENVYLNASLLGLSKSFVDAKFDEIVAFAELEQFIDNQVKFYSSGMYVRLGFAVAINMDPDILLVDEVLAVGDELFQRKCLDRVRRFQKEGRTIVVVTHSVDMVRQICDRAAVFDRGEMVAYSDPTSAARSYRKHLYARYGTTEGEVVGLDNLDGDEIDRHIAAINESTSKPHSSDSAVHITNVAIMHDHSDGRSYLFPNESMIVGCGFEVTQPIDDITFAIAIHDSKGNCIYSIDTARLDIDFGQLKPHVGDIHFHFERLSLQDGYYFVSIGIQNPDGSVVYDWHEQQYPFQMSNPYPTTGIVHMPFHITMAGVEKKLGVMQ